MNAHSHRSTTSFRERSLAARIVEVAMEEGVDYLVAATVAREVIAKEGRATHTEQAVHTNRSVIVSASLVRPAPATDHTFGVR
jgi:hypothetical protein